MKINIICAFALGVLALAGCSKDEVVSGSASLGDSKYTITSAFAYQEFNCTELALVTSIDYYDSDEDLYVLNGDYFYAVLYWDEEVSGRLVEGTYTLGDDVLDDVIYFSIYADYITAKQGTLTISSHKSGYSISFSGYTADGRAMKFNYSGAIIYKDFFLDI